MFFFFEEFSVVRLTLVLLTLLTWFTCSASGCLVGSTCHTGDRLRNSSGLGIEGFALQLGLELDPLLACELERLPVGRRVILVSGVKPMAGLRLLLMNPAESSEFLAVFAQTYKACIFMTILCLIVMIVRM